MASNEKDIAEKIFFSHEEVFADICNGLMFNGEQIIKPEDLLTESPVTQLKIDGKIHMQERDISKIWTKGNVKLSLIGIENQTKEDPCMPFRIIGYDGADYKAQVTRRKKGETKSFYPVVSLVLYFGTEHKWNCGKTLFEGFDTNIPECLKPFIHDYKTNVFDIAFLEEADVNKFKTDFCLVADYFVQKRKYEDYHPSAEKIRFAHDFLYLMDKLTGDMRFSAALTDEELTSNEGGISMCDVLDKVESRGFEKGVLQGRQEGIKEGRQEGRQEAEEKIILNALKSGKTVQEIFNFLSMPLDIIKAIAQKHGYPTA